MVTALRLLPQQQRPEKNPGVSLISADGGKLQLRASSFWSDELRIALHPGLRHAIVTENGGVRGVGVRNEIGVQAMIATMSRNGQAGS